MDSIFARLGQASSLAGVGLIVTGIQQCISGNWTVGLGTVFTGIAAILKNEGR